jgi:hypothetical protein
MSFLKRFRKHPEPEAPVAAPPADPPPSKAKGFVPPPPRASATTSTDPRVLRLEQRRQALENEIELVERSSDPDSPFQQRIAVLGTTLDFIEAEIKAATPLVPRNLPALPPRPVEDLSVSLEPVPAVKFRIGNERFEYAEEIDWAERGTQIAKSDLLPLAGNVDALIPDSIEGSIRQELSTHLDRSVFAFATDLRDRAIEGLVDPANVTLTDLAIPCPQCGDWQLWGGLCLGCLAHETRLRELNAERTRVLDERTSELEERQRQVEELSIQRRRLAQTIAEIQANQV